MMFEKTTLGQLSVNGKGSYGIAASAVPYSDELFTYLRITDINDDGTLNKSGLMSVSDEKAEQYLLKPNDIVFARTGGSTGRNYFYDGTDGEFVYAGFLIKFSIDSTKVNPRFIKYYCLSQEYRGWVHSFNTGSTRGNINAQTYANMPILLPSREQQDLLVDTLSVIDEKINLNTAINENLEQQAQALFKAWFVDFEPFGGVMPDDWQKCTLGDVSEMGAGGVKPQNATPTATHDNTVPIYSNGITDEGLYGFTDKAKIQDESVTVSARGTIGYVCLRQVPYVPIVRLVTLIPNKRIVSAKFLYHWLKTLHIAGTGTTQQQLTVPSFKKTEIIVPEYSIMEKFTVTINPLYEHILANKNQNQHLAALRDTLLPKLMNGEIDVSAVKI